MFSIPRRSPARLTPQQAHRQTSDRQAVLCEVRELPEWQAGHAPRALHQPLSRLRAGAALPAAARGKPVVGISRSGDRPRTAAGHLAARGVEAADVVGGMTAWTRESLPVTGERGRMGGIA
ncbi:sulfurtransferase [Streptomyces albospinus]|uniref:Sulfurtransferase n=1 Tax=Streptomyces albospinus TaxID=285515 RepID=A0ABQ2VLB4_9ACTN|nr:rhodanese-like domain-containing protein [Streptomyces albospinus]GGU96009.1 sulfurtransferase [Streptomyces albospinus]